MISTSISAALAETRINDLLAEADTARQVRLARQAKAARRADRHRRQPQRRTPRFLIAWLNRSTKLRAVIGTRRTAGISPTAAVCAPAERDA